MSRSTSTLPPGTLGLPLIGDTLEFLRDPDYNHKKHQKYGSVFKLPLASLHLGTGGRQGSNHDSCPNPSSPRQS